MTKSKALSEIQSFIEVFIQEDIIIDFMDESRSLYEKSLLLIAANRNLIDVEPALIKESSALLEALKKFKSERE
jgi:hypothetical protein